MVITIVASLDSGWDLFLAFLDLKMAFDLVHKNENMECFINKNASEQSFETSKVYITNQRELWVWMGKLFKLK